MVDPIPLDKEWLAANPLPSLPLEIDKNTRGKLLVIGGSIGAPGGVCLVAEAAFRAGAGKVQLAVPTEIAVLTGITVLEAGVIPFDGEGGEAALNAVLSDQVSVVIGPAMEPGDAKKFVRLASSVCGPGAKMLLDAAACEAAPDVFKQDTLPENSVLTPNFGELAQMLGVSIDEIRREPLRALREALDRFQNTVVLKGERTLVGSPDGPVLEYEGGGPGLAVSGSGDILAGYIGGLLSRGASPLTASAWGVWLHGECGKMQARNAGPIGYLAREIMHHAPALLTADHGNSH